MSMEWVELASFGTGLEADIARGVLEEADVPVLLRGGQPGIFGSAFQGMQPGGIALFVPAGARAQAEALLAIGEEEE